MSITPIPGSLRRAVIELHGSRCLKCGEQCTPEWWGPTGLHIDHVIPESMGGRTVLANLQPLCQTCNLSKGATTADYRAGKFAPTPESGEDDEPPPPRHPEVLAAEREERIAREELRVATEAVRNARQTMRGSKRGDGFTRHFDRIEVNDDGSAEQWSACTVPVGWRKKPCGWNSEHTTNQARRIAEDKHLIQRHQRMPINGTVQLLPPLAPVKVTWDSLLYREEYARQHHRAAHDGVRHKQAEHSDWRARYHRPGPPKHWSGAARLVNDATVVWESGELERALVVTGRHGGTVESWR